MNDIVNERILKYQELFGEGTTEAKAEAFDKIAACYYYGNFGTMQKSNLDTLMFSIYIEQILKKSEDDMRSYSRYNLSKWLGITQSKVDSLKVKKQLLYPIEFNWKEQFLRLCRNADYKDGNISINIPDKNLYLEIKNVIDESGGFVETTLTQNLLRVSEKYFIVLLLNAVDSNNESEDYDKLLETIKEYCPEDLQQIVATLKKKEESDYTWKDVISNISKDAACEIIKNYVPVGSNVLISAVEHITKKIEYDKNRKQLL